MNVDRLIEQVKTATERHNIDEAIIYDRKLTEYKEQLLDHIYSQANLHSKQMDYIKNYKILYHFKSYSLLLTSIISIYLANTDTTIFPILLWIIGIVTGIGYLYHNLVNDKVNGFFNRMIQTMNTEKKINDFVMNDISKIKEFQRKNQHKIEPLYQQYIHNMKDKPLFDSIFNPQPNSENSEEKQEDKEG